tara:strand:+ start:2810 stop:2962 length:153 start_codon:yes stop_codon:yes gene_type:complete
MRQPEKDTPIKVKNINIFSLNSGSNFVSLDSIITIKIAIAGTLDTNRHWP